tara:strand:+ start:2139 stop:2312 length:174 start_codon:yes stop_codon:yes gene_type:complete
MTLKSSRYWDTHKEVYQEFLDELDGEVRSIVLDDSNSHEAKVFNKKVEDETKKKLSA